MFRVMVRLKMNVGPCWTAINLPFSLFPLFTIIARQPSSGRSPRLLLHLKLGFTRNRKFFDIFIHWERKSFGETVSLMFGYYDISHYGSVVSMSQSQDMSPFLTLHCCNHNMINVITQQFFISNKETILQYWSFLIT